MWDTSGIKSEMRSASPQERHLLLDFIIGATWSLVTITCTKLPIDAPKMKDRISNTLTIKNIT